MSEENSFIEYVEIIHYDEARVETKSVITQRQGSEFLQLKHLAEHGEMLNYQESIGEMVLVKLGEFGEQLTLLEQKVDSIPSQVMGELMEGVETTGEVNPLNDRQERPDVSPNILLKLNPPMEHSNFLQVLSTVVKPELEDGKYIFSLKVDGDANVVHQSDVSPKALNRMLNFYSRVENDWFARFMYRYIAYRESFWVFGLLYLTIIAVLFFLMGVNFGWQSTYTGNDGY